MRKSIGFKKFTKKDGRKIIEVEKDHLNNNRLTMHQNMEKPNKMLLKKLKSTFNYVTFFFTQKAQPTDINLSIRIFQKKFHSNSMKSSSQFFSTEKILHQRLARLMPFSRILISIYQR